MQGQSREKDQRAVPAADGLFERTALKKASNRRLTIAPFTWKAKSPFDKRPDERGARITDDWGGCTYECVVIERNGLTRLTYLAIRPQGAGTLDAVSELPRNLLTLLTAEHVRAELETGRFVANFGNTERNGNDGPPSLEYVVRIALRAEVDGVSPRQALMILNPDYSPASVDRWLAAARKKSPKLTTPRGNRGRPRSTTTGKDA